MITGMKLRDARHNKNLTVQETAKAAGISVNTLYAWEAVKKPDPRNKKAFGKLLAFLGIAAASPKRAIKRQARKEKAETAAHVPLSASADFSTVFDIGNTSVTHSSTPRRAEPAALELARLVGFFMGDQARRSNLGQLLKSCVEHGITIHGLERIIDGNG